MSKKPTARETLRTFFWLILAAIFLAGIVNVVHPKRIPWIEAWGNQVEAQVVDEGVELVQLSGVIDILRNGSRILIDARPANEYIRGHIPGAVSVPFESVAVDGTIPVKLLRAGLGVLLFRAGVR